MFHSDRALALTAFFLERAGGSLNDIKLAKLQYIAERQAILLFGAPLANDDGVSLEHGPCLSQSLDLMRHVKRDPLWERHIGFRRHKEGEKENTVVLNEPVDWAAILSPAAADMLEEIWREFGALKKWRIRDRSHTFGEYVEVGKGGRKPIRLEEIFLAEGDPPERAAQRAEEIRYHERFAAAFGSPAAEASR